MLIIQLYIILGMIGLVHAASYKLHSVLQGVVERGAGCPGSKKILRNKKVTYTYYHMQLAICIALQLHICNICSYSFHACMHAVHYFARARIRMFYMISPEMTLQLLLIPRLSIYKHRVVRKSNHQKKITGFEPRSAGVDTIYQQPVMMSKSVTKTSPPLIRTKEERLQCVICTYLLNGPLQLPCGHRICTPCARKLKQDKCVEIKHVYASISA